MQDSARHEPIFNAPTIVVLLAGLFIAIHATLQALPTEQSDRLFVILALVPARFGVDAAFIPGGPVAAWTSFVTHAFLHGDWSHLLINTAWLLVFGSIVAKRSGALRMLGLFLVTGIAGAATYLFMHPQELGSLVGASGGLSGLMGGVLRFMFSGMDEARHNPDADASLAPLPPIGDALRDTRVLGAAGVWIAMNLVFGLLPAGVLADGVIAWEAHLGGFVAGFLLMGLFERPRQRIPLDQ